MSAVEKTEEQNPLENLDQDLAIHIYRHCDRIFEQYQQLGQHLSTLSQVRPRDVTIQYRHLFGGGRRQTEYLYDMAAVSYLVRHFNGENHLGTEQKLREIAKLAAGEALNQLNDNDAIVARNEAANETSPAAERQEGPGISKVRTGTHQEVGEEITGWLADSIDTWEEGEKGKK
jgi:hypothetical protein